MLKPFLGILSRIWPWRSRPMTPIFNICRQNPKTHIWCKFGDSSSNHYKLLGRQDKFPRTLSQNGQNELEGQGTVPHLQYQPRVSRGACLVQTCGDSSFKLEQLECLRSERPPPPPPPPPQPTWLPLVVIHIRSHVKTTSKLQIVKNAKNSRTVTCDTPSEVAW